MTAHTPRCFWLIGPPGVGKSTYVEKTDFTNAVILSSDAIWMDYANEHGVTYRDAMRELPYRKVKQMLRARLISAVLADKDIVLDQTNCTPKNRAVLGQYVPAHYQRIGVFFPWEDDEEIIKRVEKRGRETGKIVPREAVLRHMKDFREHHMPYGTLQMGGREFNSVRTFLKLPPSA